MGGGMEYTWEELSKMFILPKCAKGKIPHSKGKKGRASLYDLADVESYMRRPFRKSSKIVHCEGKDGWQRLARTVIAFSVVEAEKPIIMNGQKTDEEMVKARDFLTNENWYTDILEGLAEWPDFFKAYKAHGVAR